MIVHRIYHHSMFSVQCPNKAFRSAFLLYLTFKSIFSHYNKLNEFFRATCFAMNTASTLATWFYLANFVFAKYYVLYFCPVFLIAWLINSTNLINKVLFLSLIHSHLRVQSVHFRSVTFRRFKKQLVQPKKIFVKFEWKG